MWNETVLAYFQLFLVPRLRMSGSIPLGPLYAFKPWTQKSLPSYVTICLKVLRTKTLFIYRPICVLCSVHATYPAYPHHPQKCIFLQAQLLCQPEATEKNILFHFT
jgi:hypothetical protein